MKHYVTKEGDESVWFDPGKEVFAHKGDDN